MHLRVLRVPVVNKVLEFFSSLALQLVGLVMALRKAIAKFPSARDPVILSILSLYPVIPSKEALRKRTSGMTARKICTIVGSNFGVSAKAGGRVT